MSANPNALSPIANPNTQTIRVAAIDIGTVTCRLMIADVTPQGVDVVERHTEIVNLGEGVDATGILAPQAMDRAIKTLTRYRSIMDRCGACHPIDTTVCMATSASRDAKNAPEFLDRLAQLGISPDVIPGSKEAELSFRGASNSFRDQQLLFADIGGGSTELVFGMAKGTDLVAQVELARARSFDIGARRMTERFLQSDPPTPDQVAQARQWARETLAPFVGCGISAQRMIAVAGTATSVVAIRDRMEVYDPQKVHGSFVSRDDLERISQMLLSMTLKQRMEVVGLQPKRAVIIPAGLVILQAIVEAADLPGYTASESDILMGIVLDAVKTRRDAASAGSEVGVC